MKQNNHQFMRAVLFIAILFTSFMGVAASTPGMLTESDLPKTNTPTINASEGVGKYTVRTNSVLGSEVYCRINSGEWFHYKKPLVFDENGSYKIEAYATSYFHSPSDIVSKTVEVTRTRVRTWWTLMPMTPRSSSITGSNIRSTVPRCH